MKTLHIRKGTADEVIRISGQIPEFDRTISRREFEKRLENKQSLLLVAEFSGNPVGFKAGYIENDYFYSWLGGVVPQYRRQHIATYLAKKQEEWVLDQGIQAIRFKTQNKFKNMLLFAIKNGFRIIGTVPLDGGEGFKILLEKT